MQTLAQGHMQISSIAGIPVGQRQELPKADVGVCTGNTPCLAWAHGFPRATPLTVQQSGAPRTLGELAWGRDTKGAVLPRSL